MEEESIVLKLVLDRILYPMDLTETAEEKYIQYLREHGERAVSILGEEKEYAAMRTILTKITPDRAETEKNARACTEIRRFQMGQYPHGHARRPWKEEEKGI